MLIFYISYIYKDDIPVYAIVGYKENVPCSLTYINSVSLKKISTQDIENVADGIDYVKVYKSTDSYVIINRVGRIIYRGASNGCKISTKKHRDKQIYVIEHDQNVEFYDESGHEIELKF